MTSDDSEIEASYLSFSEQMVDFRVQPSTLKFKDLADVPYQLLDDPLIKRKDQYALDESWAENKSLLLLQSSGRQLWSNLGNHSHQEWRDAQGEVLCALETMDCICRNSWDHQRSRIFGKDGRRNVNCGESWTLCCYLWLMLLASFLS